MPECATLHTTVQYMVVISGMKQLTVWNSRLKNFQHFKEETVVPDTYQEIILSLVQHRHKLGMSQEELAHQIGCAKSLVHKWEQYKRVPSGFMFSCWLEALGLTIKVHKKKANARKKAVL